MCTGILFEAHKNKFTKTCALSNFVLDAFNPPMLLLRYR